MDQPTRPCDQCGKHYPAMHTLPLGDARDFCPRHRPKVYTPRHPRVGCGPSGVSGGRRVSREPIRADLEFHGDGYSG